MTEKSWFVLDQAVKFKCAVNGTDWHEGTMPLEGQYTLDESRNATYCKTTIYLCKKHYLQLFGEMRAGDFSIA